MPGKTEPGHPMRQVIGLSAALATPFYENGDIDWPRFTAHARGLLDGGMKTVTAFGTTGEGASIGTHSRADLFEEMEGGGILPGRIVECIYGPASDDAAWFARRAFDAGCAGILLCPPFYFREPAVEELYRWYAEVFEKAGAGCRNVLLYHIPPLSGARIEPELVSRLRTAFPEVIAGVKDSGGEWAATVALLAEHKDLTILVGHENHLAQAVQLGASGAISGIANLDPDLVGGLVTGQPDPRIDALLLEILAYPVVPAIKAALAGLKGDEAWLRTRAPLPSLSRDEANALCTALARIEGLPWTSNPL